MESLQKMLKNPDATLIDVRTKGEYLAGHIGRAINIPLDEIERRIAEINALPKPLVLYCRSGARSGMATQMLRQAGVQDVHNGGGIADLYLLSLN
mgnify:CR=1 FL=1